MLKFYTLDITIFTSMLILYQENTFILSNVDIVHSVQNNLNKHLSSWIIRYTCAKVISIILEKQEQAPLN